MKDEAHSPVAFLVEKIPIASPSNELRAGIESLARRLIDIAATQQATRGDVLDWLRVEHEILEPSTKLQSPTGLDSDAFIAEVRKLRGRKKPLSLAALKNLREEHARTIVMNVRADSFEPC